MWNALFLFDWNFILFGICLVSMFRVSSSQKALRLVLLTPHCYELKLSIQSNSKSGMTGYQAPYVKLLGVGA